MKTTTLITVFTLAALGPVLAQNQSESRQRQYLFERDTEPVEQATTISDAEAAEIMAAQVEQAQAQQQFQAEQQAQQAQQQAGQQQFQQGVPPDSVPVDPNMPEIVVEPDPAVTFQLRTNGDGAARRGFRGQAGAQSRTEMAPPVAGNNATDELRLNFRNAPVEVVLNYLSDAAGFIIQLDTPVSGRMDVWSNQTVTRDEAVDLLNSVLNRNGYAAIRNGRILRIMSRQDALHANIPVRVSEDPESIPNNDEMVTHIIPIRFVGAKQLITDVSAMLSPKAIITANEAGNSIIITDTQSNIRHMAEIIKAIDSSAENVTEVRVFRLHYHDPVEVATLLTGLFADQGNSQGVRLGGQQGGGARFGGGGGGDGPGRFARMMAAAQADSRIRQRSRIVAVADQRTSSVVVTASRDLMDQIEGMIEQIDRESPKVARVSVMRLEHADPAQVQQVLQDMFQSNNRNARNNQNSPLMDRTDVQRNQNNANPFGGLGGNRQGGGGGGNVGR